MMVLSAYVCMEMNLLNLPFLIPLICIRILKIVIKDFYKLFGTSTVGICNYISVYCLFGDMGTKMKNSL